MDKRFYILDRAADLRRLSNKRTDTTVGIHLMIGVLGGVYATLYFFNSTYEPTRLMNYCAIAAGVLFVISTVLGIPDARWSRKEEAYKKFLKADKERFDMASARRSRQNGPHSTGLFAPKPPGKQTKSKTSDKVVRLPR